MSNNWLPITVVDQQLGAHNSRDIDAFMAVFADGAQGFELGNPVPTLPDIAAIRAAYGKLFAQSPDLRSVVVNRTAFANVVIDYEHISGRNGETGINEMILIFEVEHGLIYRFHAIRKK
jgi:hypothetical protein